MPKFEEYREHIKKIAGDTYAERLARIEAIKSDIMFEADSFFGSDKEKWNTYIAELMINFEEDVVNEELMAAMQQLRIAEAAKDHEKVAAMAKKCQELSMRKAEVGKKRRG